VKGLGDVSDLERKKMKILDKISSVNDNFRQTMVEI
jgi:hypothetical protein